MSLIVEYETEPRRAAAALAARPAATLEHDEIHLTPADEVRWFFWVRGVGAGFDDALAADPTVDRHRFVTETGGTGSTAPRSPARRARRSSRPFDTSASSS
jgi:hypothetical protein